MIKLDRAVAARRDSRGPARGAADPDEDAYYVFQLVGLAVEEDGGRPLGVVADVENLPANDVARARLRACSCRSSRPACSRSTSMRGRVLVARGFADDG